MTIYLGARPVVVLNTKEAIREAFVRRGGEFLGKPQDLAVVKDVFQGKGKISVMHVCP